MTGNFELFQKALEYVKKQRFDYLLIDTFLAVRHYSKRSKTDHRDDGWDIGLKDISTEKKLLVCDELREETQFIKATFEEITFEIGGVSCPSRSQDGTTDMTFTCSLLIDERTVLTAKYQELFFSVSSLETRDLHSYDFSINSVEELHVDKRLGHLLLGISSGFNLRQQQQKLLKEQEEIQRKYQKYEGKFTFGEE